MFNPKLYLFKIDIILDRSYMHLSRPLPLTSEGPEQGFGDINCQNGSQGNLGLFCIAL